MGDRLSRTEDASGAVPVGKLVAVSYARVSTGAQADEGRSGFERQEQAIAAWLQAHPEYELDREREVRHVGSGAKAGRFEWFITELQQGRLPQGTCLVVEKLSRFSREPLGNVLRTLQRMWDAGGAIACCELYGDVIDEDRFNSQRGDAVTLVGAIQRARGEWLERQDRSNGAVLKNRRLIREGKKPFKERRKDARRALYPFWLDFNERSGDFSLNNHAQWVQQAFQWAPDVGSPTIARRLAEQGVRCPSDPSKPPSAAVVANLLRKRAVLGEKQFTDRMNKPVGDPVPGVYPPVVTADEFEAVRVAMERRNRVKTATGAKRHNIFESRLFCAHCCGRIGVQQNAATLADGSRREYFYLRCLTHHKERNACIPNRLPYVESALLDRVQSFRWDDYFSDTHHEEDLFAKRQELLHLQSIADDKHRELKNVEEFINEKVRLKGKQADVELQEEDRARLKAEHADVNAKLDAARADLQALQRRRTGMDAEREIRARVDAFRSDGCNDVEQRKAFNRWLHAEGIVMLVDLTTGNLQVGTGTIKDGRLSVLDQRLEDAEVLGVPLKGLKQQLEAHDRSSTAEQG